jgi:hypothetical protein
MDKKQHACTHTGNDSSKYDKPENPIEVLQKESPEVVLPKRDSPSSAGEPSGFFL